MSRLPRTLLGLFLPLALIAVFAALLLYSLSRLAEIEQDMRIKATQNMLWTMYQAHSSALQLENVLLKANTGAVSPVEIERRYNVLLSRIALLNEGPQRRQVEVLGFADELDRLTAVARSLAPMVADPTPANIQEIRDALHPFNPVLGRAGNAAMISEWNQLGSRLDTHRMKLWQIIWLLFGLMAAGAVLSAYLIFTLRQSRHRTSLLQRERRFSELLVASSGDGVLAADADGRCTVWNDAMHALFDVSPNQARGALLEDISGFFATARVREGLQQALAGNPFDLPFLPFFRSGEELPHYVDLRLFPLRDRDQTIGIIGLVRDVTDKHAAQEAIARHNERLEELVADRTRELNEALQQQRSAADLYRNFAAMVSHEFRTPLAIVDSALQRLVRRADRVSSLEITERATKARDAIRRLTSLVATTLDTARLDAGQVEVTCEQCDIADLAATICERQRETSPGCRIQLEATGPAPVQFDPTHAEHVLSNLISNAVKYSPDGSPISVRITLEGDLVTCSVRNETTKPLTDDDRAKLFDRYYRGSNTMGLPGTGIGLYMARALARMQNGDIELSDAEQDGKVELRFLLPRIGASPATPSLYAAPVHTRRDRPVP